MNTSDDINKDLWGVLQSQIKRLVWYVDSRERERERGWLLQSGDHHGSFSCNSMHCVVFDMVAFIHSVGDAGILFFPVCVGYY